MLSWDMNNGAQSQISEASWIIFTNLEGCIHAKIVLNILDRIRWMFLTPNTETTKLETHGLFHNTWVGLGEGLWITHTNSKSGNPVGVEQNRNRVFVQPSAVRDSNDELLNDHLRNTPTVPLLYFTAHTNSKSGDTVIDSNTLWFSFKDYIAGCVLSNIWGWEDSEW